MISMQGVMPPSWEPACETMSQAENYQSGVLSNLGTGLMGQTDGQMDRGCGTDR